MLLRIRERTPNLNNVKRILKKNFNGICFNCDNKGDTIKACWKKIVDEKNGSYKTSWRKPDSSNNAMNELELWVTAEEVCTSINTQVITTRGFSILEHPDI